jgi:hypothetical protein
MGKRDPVKEQRKTKSTSELKNLDRQFHNPHLEISTTRESKAMISHLKSELNYWDAPHNQGCGSGPALVLKAGYGSALKSQFWSFIGLIWSLGGRLMLKNRGLEAQNGALEVLSTQWSQISITLMRSRIRNSTKAKSEQLDPDPHSWFQRLENYLIRKKESELTLSVGSSLPGSTASPWGVSTLQRSATDMAQDISTSTTRDSARIASTNLNK